jgi:hypothetical protein
MSKEKTVKVMNQSGPMGFVLFLAYIGAAVYFVEQSSGFFGFLWALIKAIAWPAILLYNGLEAFNV